MKDDRPGICPGCGDMDFPHTFIWCRDYKPKARAASREIPAVKVGDCGEERFEPEAHNPKDIAEVATLRKALSIMTAKMDAHDRERASLTHREPDTFISVMKVANDN